jgi:hypothetical protein
MTEELAVVWITPRPNTPSLEPQAWMTGTLPLGKQRGALVPLAYQFRGGEIHVSVRVLVE